MIRAEFRKITGDPEVPKQVTGTLSPLLGMKERSRSGY